MNDAEELMRQAILALRAGRKEEAYRLFSDVVDLDPTNEDALLGKAGCSRDLDETILLLQKILAMNPSNERAMEGLEWAIERKRTVSRSPVSAVVEQEERASSVVPEGACEETEEVERKQRWARTSTIVVRALTVLYGLFGLFLGVKNWMISSTYGGWLGLDFPSLLYGAASRAVILAIEGFLFAAIAMSVLDSTLRKLRRLGLKRAGLLVPLILLFLSGITGALLGIDNWVNWGGMYPSPNMFLRTSSGWDIPALLLEMAEVTTIFGPFLFVGGMLVWWVVVALWSRFAGRSRQK